MSKYKYIYGLAMPFNDSYWDYEFLTNTFKFQTTNRESITLWDEIVLTIDHDYNKEIGKTEENLCIKITDTGIYFRVRAENELCLQAYNDVRKGKIKHCSITFLRRDAPNKEWEERALAVKELFNFSENIVVTRHTDVLVTEMCLTDTPANKDTFCTTDRNDKRLRGIKWD